MAKSRQVPKTAKRRLAILGPIAIFLIGYCIFTVVTTTTSLYSLHNENQKLNTKLENLKSKANNLKTEITKLQDKDYVARYARENYLYTKDGEYVIKVDNTKKTKNQTQKVNKTQKYVYYGCIGIIVLMILFIIIKHHKNKKKKIKKSRK